MKTSTTGIFNSVVEKIMVGLVLAAMIGSINVVPALGKDDHKRMEKYDNRGRGNDRNRYVHGRRDYQPYGYTPPPVIYVPDPQPGISIFLPINR